MRLLTNPSSLDDGGEHSQARLCGQGGKIVFLFSRRAVFADEPGLVPRQMLLTLVPDPLRWSVGRAHTHSRKAGFELSLRAGAPADVLPPGISRAYLRLPSIECSGRAADEDGRARQ